MSVAAQTYSLMTIGVVHDYGDHALLLDFGSNAEVLAWAVAIDNARLPGVLDIVPGARTVLVKLAARRYQEPTRQRLAALQPDRSETAHTAPGAHPDVVIDVIYDGADLDEVAQLTGLDAAQVVAAHTGTLWRVGFSGFAPGFAYLVGGDHRLQVPRRAEPRTRVPTGSVGLAGEFSGVYPRESPGGWQLIGRAAEGQEPLWDVDREDPALLTPGSWIQFRSVGAGNRP